MMKMGREPIQISSCMTITRQGVLDDYVNVWAGITAAENLYLIIKDRKQSISSEDEKLIKKVLINERKSYNNYVHEKWLEFEEKIIKNSDERIVNALDKLAESYNAIRKSIAEDFNFPLATKFVDLAVFLIRGE